TIVHHRNTRIGSENNGHSVKAFIYRIVSRLCVIVSQRLLIHRNVGKIDFQCDSVKLCGKL
ncbi:MAG: hypothetical protein AAB283_07010, partial [Planctomycetota bacterium]